MDNQEAIASLKTLCHNCELFPKCVHEKPECFQAIELAISALQAQEAKIQLSAEGTTSDLISRQAAIDALAKHEKSNGHNYTLFVDIVSECAEIIRDLPSAQPEPSEITDEQAILHLQSTGWMQNHDREMYESGLREQLADDSGSYDSLIPYEDTISRQAAISELMEWVEKEKNKSWSLFKGLFHWTGIKAMLECLPSAQPTCNQLSTDTISRQAAIDVCDNAIDLWHGQLGEGIVIAVKKKIEELPSAQPEIEERTEEFAQNVPKEDLISRKAAIDAMGKAQWAKERLMELPSAQPELCEDAVSRDSVKFLLCKETCHPGAFCPDGFCREICEKVDALPSATPKQRMREWIPVSERLPESKPEDLEYPTVIACCEDGEVMTACYYESTKEWGIGENYDRKINPVAWMPLPEPYRAERRTDAV